MLRIVISLLRFEYLVVLIFKAVSEKYHLKQTIFEQLSELVSDKAILATNTSSISITKIAANVKKDPSRFVGMHFVSECL